MNNSTTAKRVLNALRPTMTQDRVIKTPRVQVSDSSSGFRVASARKVKSGIFNSNGKKVF